VSLDRHVALAATLGTEEKEEAHCSRNGNQDNNGSDRSSVGSIVTLDSLTVGALEANLDSKIGFATGL
jgi:hypothetical protein